MSLGSMIALIKTLAGSGGGGGGGGSSGGGVLVVHGDENGVLDKTWQEIYDASNLGVVVLPIPGGGEILYLDSVIHNPPIGQVHETWSILFIGIQSQNTFVFEAESADSYPHAQAGD